MNVKILPILARGHEVLIFGYLICQTMLALMFRRLSRVSLLSECDC